MSGTKGGEVYYKDNRTCRMKCSTIVRAEEDSVSDLSNLVEAAETTAEARLSADIRRVDMMMMMKLVANK